MCNHVSSKLVKTRKYHNCHGCNRMFCPGTTMERNTTTSDGVISSSYWCKTCQVVWKKFGYLYDDGTFPGELRYNDEVAWEEIRAKVEGAKT